MRRKAPLASPSAPRCRCRHTGPEPVIVVRKAPQGCKESGSASWRRCLGPATRTTMLICYHILHNKRCACGKHAPIEDQAALNTGHMEAPPREKRARAAFFREKDAKRAAKQQRKKDKLTEKISHGGAIEKDVAPTCCSEVAVELGTVKQVEPFACGREQRAGALRPLRILPTLTGTSDRDAMVGLSSVAGRVS